MKSRCIWPLAFLLFTLACGQAGKAPDVEAATNQLIAGIDNKNANEVRAAIAQGAQADAQGSFANSALHFACESGDAALATDVLNSLGAQKKTSADLVVALSQLNKKEQSALELCAVNGHKAVVDAIGTFCESKQVVRAVVFPVTKKLATANSENLGLLAGILAHAQLGGQLIYETIGTKEGQAIIQAFDGSVLLREFARAYLLALQSSEDVQAQFFKIASGFRIGKRAELIMLMREHASRELYKTFEQQLISLSSQFGIPKSEPATKPSSSGQSQTQTQTQNEKEAPADYNALLREGVAAGNVEIVLKALEKGARLDALDSTLQNVFHVAVLNQRPEVLTTLLAQLQCSNADVVLLQKDTNGQSPFSIAATKFTKENARTLRVISEFLLSGKGCQKIAKKEIREWVKEGQEATIKNVFTVFSEANHGVEVIGDIVYRLLGGNFASQATQWVESALCEEAKDHLWARVYFKALNDGDEVRKTATRETVKKYPDTERRQVVGFMLFLGSGHSNKNIRAGILGELEHLQLPKEIFESSSDGIAEIKASLDESVTGQENAKISLAVAIKNHYERLSKGLRKSNILILGPSGTGKTLLVQTIAKTLEVPFTIYDATNITQAGYQGGKAEDAVMALAEKAGFDKGKTERGIIFLDEIDKMAGRAGKSDMDEFKRQGQATLLKLLEGIEVEVKVSRFQTIKIDTKNILFVCAGAFTGLTDIVDQRLKSEGRSLGENPYEQAIAADMIKYGVTPEMLGRLPNVIATRALSVPDMVTILNTPKQSALEEYREIFQSRGVELKFTPNAILAIGEKAIAYKTGARALKTVIESVMSDLQYRISQMGLLKSITVTERVVRFGDMPTLEYKEVPKPVVPPEPVPTPPAPAAPAQPEPAKPEQPQPEPPK